MLLNYRKASKPETGEEEGWQLDPRSALFVANKWDTVPIEDRDEIKKEIYSKLQDIWTGIDESQIFFLSASEVIPMF